MFNFFKKQQKEETPNNTIASITYIIKRGSSTPLIDVELGENDNECVDALCSLLNVLGNDMFYIDTVNMIRTLLIQSGQEDILFKILTRINDNIREKLVHPSKDKLKDEPCIKPSDMLK